MRARTALQYKVEETKGVHKIFIKVAASAEVYLGAAVVPIAAAFVTRTCLWEPLPITES
jgi:hypothetical protein